jgi:hypothetical protein
MIEPRPHQLNRSDLVPDMARLAAALVLPCVAAVERLATR